MKAEQVRIEREWLEMTLSIKGEERRELFVYACIGNALGLNSCNGFSDTELNALWRKTYIREITMDNPGQIGFKKEEV